MVIHVQISNLGKNILILKKNAFLFIVLLSFPVKSTRFEMPSRKKIGRPKGKNHSNERVIMMKNLFSTTINCQHGFQKSENVLSISAFLPK